MTELTHVPVGSILPDRFAEVLPGDAGERFLAAAARAAANLEGRRRLERQLHRPAAAAWPRCCGRCSPTRRGGGVDARWVVIDGDPEFFAGHQAHPQPPARLGRRRRRPRRRRATATTSEVLEATVDAAGAAGGRPATSSSSTTPSPPGWSAAAGARAPRGLALPRRHRRPNERTRSGPGTSCAPYVGAGRRVRRSPAGTTPGTGLDRAQVEVIAPSIDAVLGQEPGARTRRRSRPSSRRPGLAADGDARRRPVFVPRGRHAGTGRPPAEVVQRDTAAPRTRRWSSRCRAGTG